MAACQRVPEDSVRRSTVELPTTTTTPPRPLTLPTSATAAVGGVGTAAPTAAVRAKPKCVDREVTAASATPHAAAVCPPAPTPPPQLERAIVRSEETGTRIHAELVKGPNQTARGLMWRTKMAESDGMLFDLEAKAMHAFWMRNTCIPLDMLFIDEDGTIVGIVENVPVLNDSERAVACPSRYVLEVNAGFTKKRGIVPGQHLVWK